MKKIKLSKKLSLNKSTISELNSEESREIVGGSVRSACICATTDPRICTTATAPIHCISKKYCATKIIDCFLPPPTTIIP